MLILLFGSDIPQLNKCDRTKTTPAHCAVLSEDIDIVSYLLARGSDFHVPNRCALPLCKLADKVISAGDSAYSMSLLVQNKTIAWMIPSVCFSNYFLKLFFFKK